MLVDPIRQASFDAAQAIDRGPPLDAEAAAPIAGQTTFDEMLRALNPLQHIPFVGTAYRMITGDTIQPAFRVLGGALFGGVSGMLSSAVSALVEDSKPWEALSTVMNGQDAAPDQLAQARLAYGLTMGSGDNSSGA